MGKNKRKIPSLQEVLDRPWCYYCGRDFDDLRILINHQKAKHFNCNFCTRRLATSGGLLIHMNQVHKETLYKIDNALEGREAVGVEIFGMEGIPEDVLQANTIKRTEQYYAEHGNNRSDPSNANGQASVKKIKKESPEELKRRLAEFKAKKAAGDLQKSGTNTPSMTDAGNTASPANAHNDSPFSLPAGGSPAGSLKMNGQPQSTASPAPNQQFNGHTAATMSPAPFSHASPVQASPLGQAFPGQPFPAPFTGPAPQQYPGPYGMPGAPMGRPGQPMGFAGPPPAHAPFGMPPQPYPPFGQAFAPAFPPPHHQAPFQPGFAPPFPAPMGSHVGPHGGPHNIAHRQVPASQLGPQMNQKSSSPVSAPTRQNSLPSAAGLPARPSFDAPVVSRSQLHEMHAGQKPLTDMHEPQSLSAGVDRLIADVAAEQNVNPHGGDKPSSQGAAASQAFPTDPNRERSSVPENNVHHYHSGNHGERAFINSQSHRIEPDQGSADAHVTYPPSGTDPYPGSRPDFAQKNKPGVLQSTPNDGRGENHDGPTMSPTERPTPQADVRKPLEQVRLSQATNGALAVATTPNGKHEKGERTKKRIVMKVRDEQRTPEEKMAKMKRYGFTPRLNRRH